MQSDLTIAIGCDHAGVEYKNAIKIHLESIGIKMIDKGTNTVDSVDYPDYAHPVALTVESNEANFGILICGSANGVCITANKHAGIRAALCWRKDVAELARQHNDANFRVWDVVLPVTFSSDQADGGCAIHFRHSPIHQNDIIATQRQRL